MISLVQRDFVLKSLKEALRVDGRSLTDLRMFRIENLQDSVQVCLGKTRVLVSVSADIVKPNTTSPQEGLIFFQTDFSSMASSRLEGERLKEKELHISRMLEKALKRSRAVDTESLCIIAGEQCWAVRVAIHILNDEGNVLDCACVAAIAALLNFKRLDVTVRNEEVIIHPPEEKAPIPLSINHIPICITFSFFEQGNIWLLDPTAEEEQVQDGEMTIVANIHQEICTLSKAGGSPIDADVLIRCSQIAAMKAGEITTMIRNAMLVEKQKH